MKNTQFKGFFTDVGHGNPNTMSFRHPAICLFAIGPKGEKKECVGMLDTGSDLCRIDEGIAENLGFEDGGEMPSILSGFKTIVPMRKATLYIPQCDFRFDGSFPIAPLQKSETKYDVLLGMDFLKHFDLMVNPSINEVSLTFGAYIFN